MPHVVTPGGATYDRNSWIETKESWAMQENLKPDDVIFESRARKTFRKNMEALRDKDIVELDGVGGAVLLVRAEAHRRGLIFPPLREDGGNENKSPFQSSPPPKPLATSWRRRVWPRWPKPWATTPTACPTCCSYISGAIA